MGKQKQVEDEENNRIGIAIASTLSSQYNFKPAGVTPQPLSKFQELHRRRLQIKAKSKIDKKPKGRAKQYGAVCMNYADSQESDSNTKVKDESVLKPKGHSEDNNPFTVQDNEAVQLTTKKRRKLHWRHDDPLESAARERSSEVDGRDDPRDAQMVSQPELLLHVNASDSHVPSHRMPRQEVVDVLRRVGYAPNLDVHEPIVVPTDKGDRAKGDVLWKELRSRVEAESVRDRAAIARLAQDCATYRGRLRDSEERCKEMEEKLVAQARAHSEEVSEKLKLQAERYAQEIAKATDIKRNKLIGAIKNISEIATTSTCLAIQLAYGPLDFRKLKLHWFYKTIVSDFSHLHRTGTGGSVLS